MNRYRLGKKATTPIKLEIIIKSKNADQPDPGSGALYNFGFNCLPETVKGINLIVLKE